jgi:hypothetical protein
MAEVSLGVHVLNKFLRRLAVFVLALPLTALAAAPITGTVTNKTINKPSAGDAVVLIRLAQGMQESTRTTTDAHGHYTLEVPDDGLHLVRVTHDKANYFQPAPSGTQTVDIDVYNAAPQVKGVSAEAVVMRIQTDASGANVRVVEHFFVKNDSTPPMTQFSNEPFDFHLPEGAIIEGSAAQAPNGMPVQASPAPLPEKGLYTFLFPIRPGETQFQVSYHIPYNGKLDLDPRVTGLTDTVAIMLPKGMRFTPATGAAYNPVNDEVDAQTFVARSVAVGQPMGFTLTGKGELPRDTQNQSETADSGQGGGDGTIAATDNKAPGKGLDNPLDPEGNREPLAKYKLWILAGLALLLAAAAAILLRKPAALAAAPAAPAGTLAVAAVTPASRQDLLLQVMKEELFALETDRLQERIAEPEYLQQKAALELILRRALGRAAASQA